MKLGCNSSVLHCSMISGEVIALWEPLWEKKNRCFWGLVMWSEKKHVVGWCYVPNSHWLQVTFSFLQHFQTQCLSTIQSYPKKNIYEYLIKVSLFIFAPGKSSLYFNDSHELHRTNRGFPGWPAWTPPCGYHKGNENNGPGQMLGIIQWYTPFPDPNIYIYIYIYLYLY